MFFILRVSLESTSIFGRIQSAKQFFFTVNSIRKQQWYNLIYAEVTDIKSKWRYAASEELEKRYDK